MISKMKIILVVAMTIFGMNGISFAMSCDMCSGQAHAEETEKGSKATDAGNEICPVSGEKVGVMGPAIQHEHKGKIYNFCCSGCIPEFKKNPEKYIAKMEQPAGSEHSMQGGHQHEH